MPDGKEQEIRTPHASEENRAWIPSRVLSVCQQLAARELVREVVHIFEESLLHQCPILDFETWHTYSQHQYLTATTNDLNLIVN